MKVLPTAEISNFSSPKCANLLKEVRDDDSCSNLTKLIVKAAVLRKINEEEESPDASEAASMKLAATDVLMDMLENEHITVHEVNFESCNIGTFWGLMFFF